jgi:hypothetical protein
METGSLRSWAKQEGDKITEGEFRKQSEIKSMF